jgi:hypothetical protein
MTLALGVGDAWNIIDDVADTIKPLVCDLISRYNGKRLRDVNDWRWTFKGINLI